MAIPKDAGSGRFILEDGMIAGIPVYMTNHVPTNLGGGAETTIILGHWPDLLITRCSSLELATDLYTHFASGALRLRGLMDLDITLLRDESFCAAVDVTP